MKRILFILYILFFGLIYRSFGQTDNQFWLAVPYATPEHGGPVEVAVRVSMLDYADTIFITAPANPAFDTVTLEVGGNQTATADLSPYVNDISDKFHSMVNDKSLLIESKNGNKFTCYYEFTTQLNPDVFALKGKNALGYEFYTPFQTFWKNQDAPQISSANPAYSAITIVATENNTTVSISPTKPTADGHTNGDTYDVVLQKGETYRVVPALQGDGRPSVDPDDRLAGTHISSDKPIAVTLHDDSCVKGSAWDMIGDQLIPVSNAQGDNIVGENYIVMRGQLNNNSYGERLLFVPTVDSTDIFIDGVKVNANKLAAGEQFSYKYLTGTNAVNVECTNPTYLYHISGFGHETGGAVLPRIDGCTGSLNVSFVRSSTEPFFLNLMTKQVSVDSFYMVTSAGTVHIDGSWFEQVGTSDWYALRDEGFIDTYFEDNVNTGEVTKFYNTQDVFHLGIINGKTTGSGCKYGYFSDYKELEAKAITVETGTGLLIGCDLDSIQLEATGGTSYEWSPTDYLTDPYVANPIAFPPAGNNYTFNVKIYQPCYGPTDKQITLIIPESPHAFFTINQSQGCAPLEITLGNESTQGDVFAWDFGDGSPLSFSGAKQITHTYQNTTDTAQTFIITLSAINSNGCDDVYSDTVTVFPELKADYALNVPADTVGCAPMNVGIYSTSTGDADNYFWDLGDGGTRNDSAFYHTFQNFSSQDTVYEVSLVASSSYFCRDTADTTRITVHPYIEVDFALDTSTACAAFDAVIRNNSTGVDTFFLDFGDGSDTTFNSFTNIIHRYENNDTVPINNTIMLIGRNEEGCWDTATQVVSIYPKVRAIFGVDRSNGCDSVLVHFTDSSTGYQLTYSWDFGDGSTSKFQNPNHLYTNKTSGLIVDTVVLKVQDKYLCRDTVMDTINVYPYIKADFAVDTVFSCPPLQAQIHNRSVGVDNYAWIFGDGASSTTTDTNFTHMYTNSSYTTDSVYNLKLVVNNTFGCMDSLDRNITIYPNIDAGFTIDKYESCHPAQFNFTSTSQGAYHFLWNFGDNATSAKKNSTYHQYERNNDDTTRLYNVNLFVTAANNTCTDAFDTTLTVKPYLNAGFSVEDYIGCPPFQNTFDNSSVGKIDTFQWYVNNGLISTLHDTSDFSFTFNNSDTTQRKYAVRLRTANTEGCSEVFYDTVVVYPRISANYGANPGYSGCHPFHVDFIDSSEAAISYLWDFGDQSTSVQKHPQHTFENKSSTADTVYPVKLIINTNNCTDSITRNITVYSRPDAMFDVDSLIGCHPFGIAITNNTVVTNPQYSWAFGDGTSLNTTSDSSITHTYQNSSFTNDSLYNLKLRVVTPNMCMDSLSQNILVYPNIRADFNADKYASCDPAIFSFTNTSQGGQQYLWNFGDMATSMQQNTSHQYATNNTTNSKLYNVSLFVTAPNKMCTDFKDTVVSVHPFIDAEYTISDYIDCPPFTNTLINSSTGRVDTNYWYVDNNLEAVYNDSSSFTYVYDNNGPVTRKYAVRLRTANNQGCEANFYDTVAVYPRVIARYNAIPGLSGCHPHYINFNDSSQAAKYYFWDFGDNTTSKNTSPGHTFNNFSNSSDASFSTKLVVRSDNCSDSITKNVTVYAKPLARFDIDSSIACPPFDVSITNNSVVTSATYLWDYGDGDSAVTNNLSPLNHIYTNNQPAIKTYKLRMEAITGQGCKDKDSTLVQVYPNVTAAFSYDTSGCAPIEINFTNQSTNAYVYDWDFNDGQFSNEINPTHRYTNTSADDITYIVGLRAESQYGCYDSINKSIDVYPTPVPVYKVTPNFQVFDEDTRITINNSTQHRTNWDYEWSFGNGETSNSSDASFDHTYSHWPDKLNGYVLNIAVTVTNTEHNQCSNSESKEIVIRPPEPTVSINNIDSTGCEPLTVNFDALYQYQDSIIWNFDDGTIVYDEVAPVHVFDTAGIYNVKLTVKGDGGEDYDYKVIQVYRKPVVSFSICNSNEECSDIFKSGTGAINYDSDPLMAAIPDAEIKFYNKSKYADFYLWRFGNGATSREEDPVYEYPEKGLYSIELIDSTIHGCMDSLTVNQVVHILTPVRMDVPTAFKPNQAGPHHGEYDTVNDGIEDGIMIFHPYHKNVVEYQLEIFNRWGEKLFESNNEMIGWDGYYQGELCKQDVYIWKVRGKYKTGKQFEKVGTVTLLR